MRRHRYVSCMGGVWRLTERRYRAYLEEVACGPHDDGVDLDEYGTYLGEVRTVTDMRPMDAQLELDQLAEEDANHG